MVKWIFVIDPTRKQPSQPISAFMAILRGFERVASNPLLILPPLLLDLVLWFGPHLSIASLVPEGVAWLGIPNPTDPALADQIALIQNMMELIRQRFNVMVALSVFPAGMPFNLVVASASLPPGLPSLMARRLPILSPLGSPWVIRIDSPSVLLALWIALTFFGLGASILYHRWLIRGMTPGEVLGPGWLAWARSGVLFLGTYVGTMGVVFVATIAANIVPLLGAVLVMFGLGALFWATVYLAFTSHGIVRYGHGFREAMFESFLVVRSNVISALGFLTLAFGIGWISTNYVWSLPDETSWFTVLALVGYAFVSATLLAASYAFFDARKTWLVRVRTALQSARVSGSESQDNLA